jgi:hypothetical protein
MDQLDISTTTNRMKQKTMKMVSKLLHLSQITNGGEGSGEPEGHPFRGNQFDGNGVVESSSPSIALVDEWRSTYNEEPPFWNVDGEKNPKYYTVRDKSGKLVAGATTVTKGLATDLLSIRSHSQGEGTKILKEIKKQSLFIHAMSTPRAYEWYSKNGFVQTSSHQGDYNFSWRRPQKNIDNLGIDDALTTLIQRYLETNLEATSQGVSSSHLIGSLTAKGNLVTDPMSSFDLLRQQSLDYAMKHTKTLIEDGGETIRGVFKPWLKDASEELRSSISTVITDGISKGKSRDEIKKDLRAIYAGDETRIDKIAGWEIPNAQYQGAKDQYTKDDVTVFEWLLGDMPCPVCEPLGEKRFFTSDELPDDLPHNHCMCDIAPVTSDRVTSMVQRIINGGVGSGEHELHPFRGNQWDSSSGYPKGSCVRSDKVSSNKVLSPTAMRKIVDIESRIKNELVEHVYMFDGDGNILAMAVGDENQVTIPVEKLKEIREKIYLGQPLVDSHNHPDGLPAPSTLDYKFWASNKVTEGRIVTPSRITVIRSIGEKPLPPLSKQQIEGTKHAMIAVYNRKYTNDELLDWNKPVGKGYQWKDEKSQRMYDTMWQRLGLRYGFTYESEELK